MQDGMIDLGRGAYPVLYDVDSDGLIDLVATNKENYHGAGSTPYNLWCIKIPEQQKLQFSHCQMNHVLILRLMELKVLFQQLEI